MEQALRMIENHGLTLIALLAMVVWLRPKIDDMWKLLLNLANPKTEPLPEKLAKSDAMDDKVMALLRSVLTEFRASRAYVFSYHNGGENVLGSSFARVSCSHEVVALGIRPQQPWLQNMPKTLVHAFVKMIDSGLGVFCPCIESCFMEADASTYETLRNQGIASCYCVGLYSDARFPIGFIGIDYCGDQVELTEAQFDKLKILAERAATLFCLNGHKLCHLQE